jgi:hypothetical protein
MRFVLIADRVSLPTTPESWMGLTKVDYPCKTAVFKRVTSDAPEASYPFQQSGMELGIATNLTFFQ